MKKQQSLLIIIFLLLITSSISAQYGNGYGNGGYGGMNGGGLDRRIGGSNSTHESPSERTPDQIKKERDTQIDKIVEILKTKLSLDELQVYAVKKELTDKSNSMGIIMKSKESDDEKMAEFKSLSERSNKNILDFLYPNQKEIYKKLIEEGMNTKESKRSKKEKKVEKSELDQN